MKREPYLLQNPGSEIPETFLGRTVYSNQNLKYCIGGSCSKADQFVSLAGTSLSSLWNHCNFWSSTVYRKSRLLMARETVLCLPCLYIHNQKLQRFQSEGNKVPAKETSWSALEQERPIQYFRFWFKCALWPKKFSAFPSQGLAKYTVFSSRFRF